MRKRSLATLTVYLAICAVLLLVRQTADLFKTCEICFLFGIGWQTFTLTKPGFWFVNKLNGLFIKRGKEVSK